MPSPKEPRKTRKKQRISKLAQCIRKTAATARIKKNGMVDKPAFDPKSLTHAISGKFYALIQKIRELDAGDLATQGTKYKHFIFTDIREAAYGAKALAGFMIAAGFDFRMGNVAKMIKRKGKMVKTKNGETALIHKRAVPGGCDGFALLQSLPLWNTPLMVNVKKDILNTFNSRPDNVNGELLRIIVLDSKFKEGIDLKDVKYVHLLEPPIATSDLKQAVGRATRFCGQSGLHFIPRRGWPLAVFTYHTVLPGRPPFISNVSEQKVDAHALMLKHSGLDLAMIHLTKELTVLAMNCAVDYDLNYKINNFELESAVLDAVDDELFVGEISPASGGGDKRGSKKVVGLYSTKDLTPKVLAKCFKRSNKLFPFSKQQLRATAITMGYKIPDIHPREFYCKLLQSDPDYLERMQTAPVTYIRGPRGPRTKVVATTPNSNTSAYFSPPPASIESSISNSNVQSAIRSLDSKSPSPEDVYKTQTFRDALKALKNLPFSEFQTAVAALYASFKWESPIVKSGCGIIAAARPGQPVSFTQTQDFVRHYLTPDSPFKGLLAWHSVGTGKTCMAVAAATSEFEAAGYTILWVTRNALMSDVYKNIFGAVCSIPIISAVKDGVSIPEDIGKAKRMLSRAWLPPITYRMFQNALLGKNELGRMLAAKHASDPLHKTFLIMDEVHKLMDGDLSAAESADFSVIQNFIQKSYAVSKKNSVRPLLMTATPITDSPRELFAILNTLIGEPSRRFMEFESFRRKYTLEDGQITAEGATYFQDRAKGLISYLNREYDPTTFAQPYFTEVIVPAGEHVAPALDDLVARCTADLDIPDLGTIEDCLALEEMEANEIEAHTHTDMKPAALKKVLANIRKTYKKRRSDCEKANKETRKAHNRAIKMVMKDAMGCYSAQKKAFGKKKGTSQMQEVTECFGKKQKIDLFPAKNTFQKAIQTHFAESDDVDSVRSNTGAVIPGED